MGYEFPHVCHVGSRKLVWLAGIMLATILLFQCVEFPLRSFRVSISSHPMIKEQGNSSSGSWNFSTLIPNPSVTPDLITLSSRFGDANGAGERSSNNSRTGGDWVSSDENADSDNRILPRDQVENKIDELLIPGMVQASENGSSRPEAVLISDLRTPLESNLSKANTSSLSSQTDDFSVALETSGSLSIIHEPTGAKSEKPGVGFGGSQRAKDLAATPAVLMVADMHHFLQESRLSSHSMIPRWSMAVDKDLVYAKSQIEVALPMDNDQGLYAPIYHNFTKFQRSYELMEKMLKVYIYKEGKRPVFHTPTLEGIYASEGWFMKLLESNRNFVTKKAQNAHLFYLPFGSRNLVTALYVPNSHSSDNLVEHLKQYRDQILTIYRYWNRTGGADHFFVACHDWAPFETRNIMKNCIRALCNSDVKEGFEFGKDISLPETFVPKSQNPLRNLGGQPASRRRILAFFAGQMHGHVRPFLLKHWQDKEPDMKIFGTLHKSKGNRVYVQYMKSSKYCICPRGYEVNSPRVVEAIFYECVPVIISDGFVPPFYEILNWEAFSVFVMEKDIPNLRDILLSIPVKTYLRMQMRVKRVQQHFLWHPNPMKYDLFHMILHSIWLNRVFQFTPKP
ncbi:hypothetical protein Drorol1_Dr00027781 [Drosera rotundifolia]